MMPLMLLSGVFYPITALPETLQSVLYWLPLIHAIQLIRPLIAGLPVTDVALHLAVLAAYGVAGYLVALYLIRRRLRV
jgi:lipooligosaccharide transport system permease protein